MLLLWRQEVKWCSCLSFSCMQLCRIIQWKKEKKKRGVSVWEKYSTNVWLYFSVSMYILHTQPQFIQYKYIGILLSLLILFMQHVKYSQRYKHNSLASISGMMRFQSISLLFWAQICLKNLSFATGESIQSISYILGEWRVCGGKRIEDTDDVGGWAIQPVDQRICSARLHRQILVI